MAKCPLCQQAGYQPPAKGKRPPGRPSALTPEIKKQLLDEIRIGATYTDAAQIVGLSPNTITQWLGKARQGKGRQYVEFLRDLEKARADRRRYFRTKILALANKKGDWRGTAFIATVTEREHFAQRVHVVVEEQLNQAVERLVKEFSREGDEQLLERALSALVGEDRSRSPVAASALASGALVGAGEELDPSSALEPAAGVPGSDV